MRPIKKCILSLHKYLSRFLINRIYIVFLHNHPSFSISGVWSSLSFFFYLHINLRNLNMYFDDICLLQFSSSLGRLMEFMRGWLLREGGNYGGGSIWAKSLKCGRRCEFRDWYSLLLGGYSRYRKMWAKLTGMFEKQQALLPWGQNVGSLKEKHRMLD